MTTLLARHSAESAVCFGTGGVRTALQFAAYARAILSVLPSAGSDTLRTRVVLACTDRYRFSAALAAIWMRGLTAELPVNGQPAIVNALARGPCVLALLHDREEALGIDVRPLEPLGEGAHSHIALPLELALGPGAPAVIAYTSGSTGEPTPHVKTLAQLLREPEAQLVAFDLAGRRIVAAVPPYHIYGLLFGVLVPLLGGGSMSRTAPLQPAALLHELESAQADVLISVPPQLAAMAAYFQSGESAPRATDGLRPDAELAPASAPRARWPALEHVFSSAAPLPADTSRALLERGWRVTEILGSTETGGIAHRSTPDAPWEPLPSVRLTVDDEGALSVDSPWLSPDVARPLRTADRVELTEGGFRHLGRSDAVVKVGGRRIDLGDVETRLKQCAGVRDARVLAVETRGVRGTELVAVLEGDDIELASLRGELCRHIDPVAVPRRFRVVDKLPRSATGKLARADLLALFDVWRFPREELPDGRLRFTIPHDLGFFRGHFDEVPILPGVVQLEQLVLRETRKRFPELSVLSRLSRVKFKRLTSPGEVMDLTLTRRGPLTVNFAIDVAGQPAASGTLSFMPSEDAAAGEEPR